MFKRILAFWFLWNLSVSVEARGTVLTVRGSQGELTELSFWAEKAEGQGWEAIPWTREEDGRFRLELPARRVPQTLWVRAPKTAFRAVAFPFSEPLELSPSGTLRLTIQAAQPGDPLPEAVSVGLWWLEGSGAPARVVPDPVYAVRWDRSRGILLLEGLPFGPGHRYEIELSSPGYQTLKLSGVGLLASQRSLPVLLRRVQQLCGTVGVPDGFAEREKVGVELRWAEGRSRVFADANGRFCFPEAPVGVGATLQAESNYRVGSSVELVVPTEELRLELPPLEFLSGEVVAPGGKGIGECHLTVQPVTGLENSEAILPELEKMVAATRVEASCEGGSFRLPRPWPDTPLRLEVKAPPWPVAQLSLGEKALGEGLRVVLSEGNVVVGAVRDGEREEPIPGARVSLVCPESAPAEATTDGDGTFTLTGVRAASRCEGRVEHPDFVPYRGRVQTGREGSTRWEVTLRRGSRVRGRVLALPDGSPIAGVQVFFISEDGARSSTTSQQDGSFVSSPLGPGRWGVVAFHEGMNSEPMEVVVPPSAEPEAVTVWLARGLEVWGRVVGLAPPGQGAVVTLQTEGSNRSRVTTGYGGEFRARGLFEGRAFYTVRHPSLSVPCSGEVWIPPDTSRQPVELRCVPPSLVVELRVRDALGQPVAEAALFFESQDGSSRVYSCQVENGIGRVELVPSDYRVSAFLEAQRKAVPIWQGSILTDQKLELVLPPSLP